MKVEVRYWRDEREDDTPLQKRKFGDFGSPEFECVQEWYLIFLAKGASPRKEIIKWWFAMYPERARKDKLYTKLNKHIDWWDKHTSFCNMNEKKTVITKTIDI